MHDHLQGANKYALCITWAVMVLTLGGSGTKQDIAGFRQS